jgi:hypothetical protein
MTAPGDSSILGVTACYSGTLKNLPTPRVNDHSQPF